MDLDLFYIFYISPYSLFLAFEYYRWSVAGRSPAARCSDCRGKPEESLTADRPPPYITTLPIEKIVKQL